MSTGNGSLLRSHDPEPVEIVNGDSDSKILLVCEHAGTAVPEQLGDLGLPPGTIDTHIGSDIGAEGVARHLADRFGAPLVIQRYSRLVVDCNRPPESAAAMPEVSDGTTIPANVALSVDARESRRREIFDPFDAAIEGLLDKRERAAAFSVHSFTPVMNGQARPWHLGLLARRDADTSHRILARVATRQPDLTLIRNQPYQISDDTDWFIPRHAEVRGCRHALIEIRNDQVAVEPGQSFWADLLFDAIDASLVDPT